MTKEYHVYTNIQPDHEQAFVFEIEREDDNFVIGDLWTITIQKNGEVRTRVNLSEIFNSISQQIGGNIDDSNMSIVMDLFKDIIPEEKQLEIQIDLIQKELNKSYDNMADKLIKAGELSEQIDFQNNQHIQNLIDSINKKK